MRVCLFVRFYEAVSCVVAVFSGVQWRVGGFGCDEIVSCRAFCVSVVSLDFIDCLFFRERFVATGRSDVPITALFGKLRVEVEDWD